MTYKSLIKVAGSSDDLLPPPFPFIPSSLQSVLLEQPYFMGGIIYPEIGVPRDRRINILIEKFCYCFRNCSSTLLTFQMLEPYFLASLGNIYHLEKYRMRAVVNSLVIKICIIGSMISFRPCLRTFRSWKQLYVFWSVK